MTGSGKKQDMRKNIKNTEKSTYALTHTSEATQRNLETP